MADKTKDQLKSVPRCVIEEKQPLKLQVTMRVAQPNAVEEIKSIHIQAAMPGGIERTDYYYSYY